MSSGNEALAGRAVLDKLIESLTASSSSADQTMRIAMSFSLLSLEPLHKHNGLDRGLSPDGL